MENEYQSFEETTPDSGVSSESGEQPTAAALDSQISELMKSPDYLSGQNPKLHRELVEKVFSLRQQKESMQPQEDPMETAIADAMAAKAQRQEQLVSDAQAEMDKLAELGFESSAVPDDVQPYQVRGLQEQRLHAEGDYPEVITMLEKDFIDLGDREGAQMLMTFEGSKVFDEDFRKEILENVIYKVHSLNKTRFTKKGKQSYGK